MSSAAKPLGESDPQIPARLGRYQIASRVAAGGMATVFLARRLDVPSHAPAEESVVALKVIHPHLASELELNSMFFDEARMASQVHHRNVCRVLDFGIADGVAFLAMDFVLGETAGTLYRALEPWRDQRRSAHYPRLMARVMADAAAGLEAAHNATDAQGRPLNLVHRDVSPDNIIVGFDGRVQLVDFGVARADARVHETRVGIVKGRFAYMAPEQMRGQVVDRRADVWSLGVVLWELLACERLFRRESDVETALAVVNAPVPRLREKWADVPRALERIVARAVQRDPADRYQSAREMREELLAYVDGEAGGFDERQVADSMCKVFPDRLAKKRRQFKEAGKVAPEQSGLASRPARDAWENDKTTRLPPKGADEGATIVDPGLRDRVLGEVQKDALMAANQGRPAQPGLLAAVTPSASPASRARSSRPEAKSAPRGPRQRSERPRLRVELEPEPRPAPAARSFHPGQSAGRAPRSWLALTGLLLVALPVGVLLRSLHSEPANVLDAMMAAPAESAAEFMEEAVPDPAKPVAPKVEDDAMDFGLDDVDEPEASARLDPERDEPRARSRRRRGRAERRARAPRRRARRSSAKDGVTGIVDMSTPGGWAEVRYRGRKLGTTPGRFELPVGDHEVTLIPFGEGEPIRTTVEVYEDEPSKVTIRVQ